MAQNIAEKPGIKVDEFNRPLCTNCIAQGKPKPRVCRRGSNLCSRCTMKGIESQLRDVLPGMKKVEEHFAEAPVDEVSHAEEVVEHAEEMIEEKRDDLIVPAFASEEEERIWWDEHKEEVEKEIQKKAIQKEDSEVIVFDANKDYYTRKQVSKMIGVSPTTICRWEQKGVVPRPKRIAHNNQLLYTDEIVEALKAYKTQVIETNFAPIVPKSAQEIAAKNLVRKTFKLNKKAEKAVARSISLSGFRSGRLM